MNRRSRVGSVLRTIVGVSLTAVCFAVFLTGFARTREEAKEAKIERAMSGGPPGIAKNAKIVEIGASGMTTLREGNNGWTCFPGDSGVVGDDACLVGPAMQWLADLMAHKPKPTNTTPGLLYMLNGGTSPSATDPWATGGTPIKEPPHWAIMWPFDPKKTGLPDKPKATGTWIMYAGTPYAHLMINQKP